MRRLVLVAAGVELVAALVSLAALPTGAATPEAVVPGGARVAATTPVGGDARVLLLSDRGRLRVLVAYRGEKGWFAVPVKPPPRTASVAWAATSGGGRIPALSLVYGRLDGARVRVHWNGGATQETAAAPDGTFLVAKRSRLRSAAVEAVAADGAVLTRVEGP